MIAQQQSSRHLTKPMHERSPKSEPTCSSVSQKVMPSHAPRVWGGCFEWASATVSPKLPIIHNSAS